MIIKLVSSIIICQAAGGLGSIFTTPAIPTWYASLNKPVFTPPNRVFGPVCITLFFLMGIALFIIWKKGLELKYVRVAFIIFLLALSI